MPGLDRSIVEHRLPIKSSFKPNRQPPQKIYKDEVLADVKKEVERLLDANFVRPCRYAEWISNIVPVYKKNGKMRVFIDFRDLKRATPMDGYPMPVADLLVDAAAGHKVISFMDGNAGYNQIFMAIEDISKTAFRCPGHMGLFEWIDLTFGLKNAGGEAQGRRRSAHERSGIVHARAGACALGVRLLQALLERRVEASYAEKLP
jgi:hypothetical protein